MTEGVIRAASKEQGWLPCRRKGFAIGKRRERGMEYARSVGKASLVRQIAFFQLTVVLKGDGCGHHTEQTSTELKQVVEAERSVEALPSHMEATPHRGMT